MTAFDSRLQAASFMCDEAVRIIQPPCALRMDEWAEANIRLPSNTAEPGRLSLERTPYSRAWLRDLDPYSGVQTIVLVTGAQLGKTTTWLTAIDYYATESPSPMIFAFSAGTELPKFVTEKLNPFIDSNEPFQKAIRPGVKGSTGSTLTRKDFAGGFLLLSGLQSAKAAKSMSVRIVFIDELDEAPGDLEGQGDPVELYRVRLNTYGRRSKLAISSTPTNFNSHILRQYAHTDQRKLFMSCPHCHGRMTFEWPYMHWELDERGTVVSAWQSCPMCGGRIYNHDKLEMMQEESGAAWEPTAICPDPTAHGYHISTLYSPPGWISFTDLAAAYLKAKAALPDPSLMTSFYNTFLALPYQPGQSRPDIEKLMLRGRASPYRRGELPPWTLLVTTGSDVQKNRIETTVMAWGRDGRRMPVEHYVLETGADTDTSVLTAPCWAAYESMVLRGRWRRTDGTLFSSLADALDRSYNPSTVDAFWRLKSSLYLTGRGETKLISIRGVDAQEEKVPIRRQTTAHGGEVPAIYWNTAVSVLKHEVYGALKKAEGEPSSYYLPQGFDESWYSMLVAEEWVPPAKSSRRGEWKKIESRNEALDTNVYNLAAWYWLGMHSWSSDDYDKLEKEVSLIACRQAGNPVQGPVQRQRAGLTVVSKGMQA